MKFASAPKWTKELEDAVFLLLQLTRMNDGVERLALGLTVRWETPPPGDRLRQRHLLPVRHYLA